LLNWNGLVATEEIAKEVTMESARMLMEETMRNQNDPSDVVGIVVSTVTIVIQTNLRSTDGTEGKGATITAS
jgi:hypothetical protein